MAQVIRTRNGITYANPCATDWAGVECVVDLDDPETARYMDAHSGGEEVLRLAIVKGGKRAWVHVSVANFYGGRVPDVIVEVSKKDNGTKRTKIKAAPSHAVRKNAAGEYETAR